MGLRRGQARTRRNRKLPPPDVRRRIILDAAADAFAADGIHGATMEAISRRAALPKPLLYEHWRSKDELFEAVAAHESELLQRDLFAGYARAISGSPRERMRTCVHAFLDYARERPSGFRLLFQTSAHASSSVASRVEAIRKLVLTRVAEMLRRELEAFGNPTGQVADVLAAMIVGMSELAVRRCMEEPGWDPEAIVDLVASFSAAGGAHVDRRSLEGADRPIRPKRGVRRETA